MTRCVFNEAHWTFPARLVMSASGQPRPSRHVGEFFFSPPLATSFLLDLDWWDYSPEDSIVTQARPLRHCLSPVETDLR